MATNHLILNTIFKNVSFTKFESDLILNKIEKIELKKGDVLLKSGKKVNYQYYVLNGCLRTYFTDKQGKEHTIQFAINDWWISDYTAFFSEGIAIMNISTIEDSILFKIAKKDIDELLIKIPKLESFFRKKMEKSFASFQKRILASMSQSAKERYLSFITSYPNIEKSVKNYHIASYLGITTESLSRIRREISKQ